MPRFSVTASVIAANVATSVLGSPIKWSPESKNSDGASNVEARGLKGGACDDMHLVDPRYKRICDALPIHSHSFGQQISNFARSIATDITDDHDDSPLIHAFSHNPKLMRLFWSDTCNETCGIVATNLDMTPEDCHWTCVPLVMRVALDRIRDHRIIPRNLNYSKDIVKRQLFGNSIQRQVDSFNSLISGDMDAFVGDVFDYFVAVATERGYVTDKADSLQVTKRVFYYNFPKIVDSYYRDVMKDLESHPGVMVTRSERPYPLLGYIILHEFPVEAGFVDTPANRRLLARQISGDMNTRDRDQPTAVQQEAYAWWLAMRNIPETSTTYDEFLLDEGKKHYFTEIILYLNRLSPEDKFFMTEAGRIGVQRVEGVDRRDIDETRFTSKFTGLHSFSPEITQLVDDWFAKTPADIQVPESFLAARDTADDLREMFPDAFRWQMFRDFLATRPLGETVEDSLKEFNLDEVTDVFLNKWYDDLHKIAPKIKVLGIWQGEPVVDGPGPVIPNPENLPDPETEDPIETDEEQLTADDGTTTEDELSDSTDELEATDIQSDSEGEITSGTSEALEVGATAADAGTEAEKPIEPSELVPGEFQLGPYRVRFLKPGERSRLAVSRPNPTRADWIQMMHHALSDPVYAPVPLLTKLRELRPEWFLSMDPEIQGEIDRLFPATVKEYPDKTLKNTNFDLTPEDFHTPVPEIPNPLYVPPKETVTWVLGDPYDNGWSAMIPKKFPKPQTNFRQTLPANFRLHDTENNLVQIVKVDESGHITSVWTFDGSVAILPQMEHDPAFRDTVAAEEIAAYQAQHQAAVAVGSLPAISLDVTENSSLNASDEIPVDLTEETILNFSEHATLIDSEATTSSVGTLASALNATTTGVITTAPNNKTVLYSNWRNLYDDDDDEDEEEISPSKSDSKGPSPINDNVKEKTIFKAGADKTSSAVKGMRPSKVLVSVIAGAFAAFAGMYAF